MTVILSFFVSGPMPRSDASVAAEFGYPAVFVVRAARTAGLRGRIGGCGRGPAADARGPGLRRKSAVEGVTAGGQASLRLGALQLLACFVVTGGQRFVLAVGSCCGRWAAYCCDCRECFVVIGRQRVVAAVKSVVVRRQCLVAAGGNSVACAGSGRFVRSGSRTDSFRAVLLGWPLRFV